jgi:predicted DNA-binding transcriptional regulator AlpA
MSTDVVYLTTKQLCEKYQVGRSTIMRWREQGMPYLGKDRSIRYNPEEVEKWLKEQTKK